MIGWLIPLVYAAGFMLSAVPITRAVIGDSHPDDLFEGILISMLGVMLAFFWPLALAGWFVYTRAVRPTVKSGKP